MKILVVSILLLLSQSGLSAISSDKNLSKTILASPEEILTLPEGLRAQHFVGRENELYSKMIDIAFSTKQPVEMRWKALTTAAALKKQNSVIDLRKALSSPEWFMRNAALLALHSVSSIEGKKAAQALIDDKALVVRSAAVEVLGPMMDQEIRDLFWRELEAKYNYRQKQSLWIREQFLKFLAENPVLAEKPLFENLSKESMPAMKSLAQSALSKLL